VNTGWYIHGAIFDALSRILPEKIQAGNGLMSYFQTYGVEGNGKIFNAQLFCGGGRGATAAGDGMGLNMFPSSASNVPVEVFELNTPSLLVNKEFIQDSPGAGKYRGAPGQRVTISKLAGHPHPLIIYFHPHRLLFSAKGVFGGKDGTRTRLIFNGKVLSDEPESMSRGYVTLENQTDRLTIEFPSGGGIYNPRDRDPLAVARDLLNGFISVGEAEGEYGVNPSLLMAP
jgi:N-methylhydantoinase B/oxoprolinase/acetone carboxylase alpha subunit